jgi:hypothetical protein
VDSSESNDGRKKNENTFNMPAERSVDKIGEREREKNFKCELYFWLM